MKWLKKIWDFIAFWKKDKPDPQPEPTNPCKGYTIRLKTYKQPYYKDRRFSCKLDKRFYHDQGCRGDNTDVTVDGVLLKFYGIDMENGRMDLAFCDKVRPHTDLPKPVMLRIYKDGMEIANVRIAEWAYYAVDVTEKHPANPKPVFEISTSDVGGITSNVPPFTKGMDESKWSKDPKRNYGGRRLLPNENWKGSITFGSKDEATNFRYRLRSHIEWDDTLEGGYKGKVYCGYSDPGALNVQAQGNKVTWARTA